MMKPTKLIALSALAASLAFAAPAVAQQNQDNDNTTTGASGNNSDTLVVNDLIDMFVQDNAADSWSDDDQHNGNTTIKAYQTLSAVNTNQYLDEVVDLDGEDASETAVGYNSGENYVRGNAFAAYAGILNQAWNTGVNSNAQAATNIAAQGTVNFGVNSGNSSAADGGGSSGGD